MPVQLETGEKGRKITSMETSQQENAGASNKARKKKTLAGESGKGGKAQNAARGRSGLAVEYQLRYRPKV